METQDIKTTQHSQIVKKINYSNIVLSIVFVIAGLSTFFITSGMDKEKSSLIMSLYFLAVCLIIVGIVLFFIKGKYDVYQKTNSPVKYTVLAFEKKDMNTLKDILAQDQFIKGSPISFIPNSNSHLDVIVSKDNQFVAAQLKEFIPFTFQAATPVYYFYESSASAFIDYLKQCTSQKF
jgi:hypothetical protein